MPNTPIDLVCVSHLWWDWVWQRPQHLMSRLAHERQVLWVEEPRIQIGPPATSFEVTEVHPHVRVTLNHMTCPLSVDVVWQGW